MELLQIHAGIYSLKPINELLECLIQLLLPVIVPQVFLVAKQRIPRLLVDDSVELKEPLQLIIRLLPEA